MSAKSSGNSDTQYNKQEGSSNNDAPKGGRKRKELSPERTKDQAKRSFKERGPESKSRSERPARKDDREARPARDSNGGGEKPNRKGREEGESARSYNKRADRTSTDRSERRDDARPPRSNSDRPYNKSREDGDRPSYKRADKPFERRDDRGEERGGEQRDRKPYERKEGGERKPYQPRESADRKPSYGRSDEKKPYNRDEKSGDRPFKKYVPFEDRKDKSTHLDDNKGERKPYQDRKRDNNDPRGKRTERPDRPERTERPDRPERSDRPERRDTPRADGKKAGKPNPRAHFENEDFYEDERPFTRSTKWNEQAKAGPMTLNKYLAHSGISSRREAAEIVKSGKVKVNGEVVLEPGYRVKEGDKITHDDKVMKPQEKMVYILLNKPKDYITTTDDEKGRKKVMDLVASAGVERLYPIGRLDRNTTGVLLITNDGDLAQKLSHPSYNSKKIYQVTLDRFLTKTDFDKIVAGVKLEDGIAPVDALAYLDKKNEIGIEIHTGRNRIVRRIFEGLGYVVEKLDRVVFAGLTKKNVGRGKWRFLTEKEVINLKHFKA